MNDRHPDELVSALRKLTTYAGNNDPKFVDTRAFLTGQFADPGEDWDHVRTKVVDAVEAMGDAVAAKTFLVAFYGDRSKNRMSRMRAAGVLYDGRTVNRHCRDIATGVIDTLLRAREPVPRETQPRSLKVRILVDKGGAPPYFIEEVRVVVPRGESMTKWSGAVQYDGRPQPQINHIGDGRFAIRSEQPGVTRVLVHFSPPADSDRTFSLHIDQRNAVHLREPLGQYGYTFTKAPELFEVSAQFGQRPTHAAWAVYETIDDCPEFPVSYSDLNIEQRDDAWHVHKVLTNVIENAYYCLMWFWERHAFAEGRLATLK